MSIEHRAKSIATVGGAVIAIGTIYFATKGYVLDRASAWAQEQAEAVIEATYGEAVQQTQEAVKRAEESAAKAAATGEHYACINIDRRPRWTCDCEYRHRDKTETRRQYLCSQAGSAERARVEAAEEP